MSRHSQQQKLNILVADDDRVLRETFNEYLSAEGYRVLVATDGRRALEVAREMQPDLIFLDVIMPVLDGFQTLEKLRTHVHTRHIPVIMVTAKTDTTTLMTALHKGADDFIAKPFLRSELLRKLRFVLLNSSERRQISAALLGDRSAAFAGGEDITADRDAFIIYFDNVYITFLRLIDERNQPELRHLMTRLLDTIKLHRMDGIRGSVMRMLMAVTGGNWAEAIEALDEIYNLVKDLRRTVSHTA